MGNQVAKHMNNEMESTLQGLGNNIGADIHGSGLRDRDVRLGIEGLRVLTDYVGCSQGPPFVVYERHDLCHLPGRGGGELQKQLYRRCLCCHYVYRRPPMQSLGCRAWHLAVKTFWLIFRYVCSRASATCNVMGDLYKYQNEGHRAGCCKHVQAVQKHA